VGVAVIGAPRNAKIRAVSGRRNTRIAVMRPAGQAGQPAIDDDRAYGLALALDSQQLGVCLRSRRNLALTITFGGAKERSASGYDLSVSSVGASVPPRSSFGALHWARAASRSRRKPTKMSRRWSRAHASAAPITACSASRCGSSGQGNSNVKGPCSCLSRACLSCRLNGCGAALALRPERSSDSAQPRLRRPLSGRRASR
jgi:hypothetical protein